MSDWLPWVTELDLGAGVTFDRRTHAVLTKVQVRLYAEPRARLLATGRSLEQAYRVLAASMITPGQARLLAPVPAPFDEAEPHTAGVHDPPARSIP